MNQDILKLNLALLNGCTARHTMVFAAWDSLEPGGAFIIENDHDPIPLRRQLSARGGDEVEWEYLQRGPETFRVKISRRAS